MAIPTESGPTAMPCIHYAKYGERCASPWHRDAFPDELKGQAPEQGERVQGWMMFDWYENPVLFVPDGTPLTPKIESDKLTNAARDLYKPPFTFSRGYFWDSPNEQMVADHGGDEVPDAILARLRGWGHISYRKNPEALQDEVGRRMAIILSRHWNDYIDPAAPISKATP